MHFLGEKDASIPMSDVDLIKSKRGGDCEIYVYPDAQHGFHCDERGSYQKAAADPRLAALDGVPGEERKVIRDQKSGNQGSGSGLCALPSGERAG